MDAEALIVGAGPAGASLAALLAERGRRVLLVDRAHFPRDKTCGECLSPGAIAVLERLEVTPELTAAGAWPYRGIRLVAGGRLAEARYPVEHSGLTLSRRALDACLLERARQTPGVTVLEGAAVESLVPGGVALADGTVLRAPVVVGADGRYSLVRRLTFGAGPMPKARRFCFLNTFGGGALTDDMLECGLVAAGLQYLRVYQGDGRYSVCLVVDEANRQAHDPGKPEGFLRLVAAQPRLAERVGEAALAGPMKGMPLAPYRAPRLVADGLLLVGDAVGYMDPITGEGMCRALVGAVIAAETIDAALASGAATAAALAPYEAALNARFEPVLRFVSLAVRATTLPPAVAVAFVGLVAAAPPLASAIAAVQGAIAPPGHLFRPHRWIGSGAPTARARQGGLH